MPGPTPEEVARELAAEQHAADVARTGQSGSTH
jgi:hypothetical protein